MFTVYLVLKGSVQKGMKGRFRKSIVILIFSPFLFLLSSPFLYSRGIADAGCNQIYCLIFLVFSKSFQYFTNTGPSLPVRAFRVNQSVLYSPISLNLLIL